MENTGWDGLLPGTFRLFRTELPDVTLELTPLNSPEQLRRIQDGTLDGGFIYQYDAPPAGITPLPLLDNGVVLAVPRAWELTPGPHGMSLSAMRDRPFILFPRKAYPAYYDCLIEACHRLGITLRITQEADTEAAILSLVCAGMGAAIVNAANLGRPPAQVAFFPLSDLSIAMPLVFAHADNATNPVLPHFMRILKNALDEVRTSPQPGMRKLHPVP